MHKLDLIRRKLSALRVRRALVREACAAMALATGMLWILAATFAVDFVFELDIAQRMVVFVCGGLTALWVFVRFAWPLLGWPETVLDMALLVEQRQGIDGDLVAALQFETAEANEWGSPQLQAAVIDRVAAREPSLPSMAAVSYEQLRRRGQLFLLTAIAAAALMLAFPDYVRVFFDRLQLRSTHYPTHTVIERIVINTHAVLDRARHPTQPASYRCAQLSPITLLVECSGRVPAEGSLRMGSLSGGKPRPITLQRRTLEDRAAWLTKGAGMIELAINEQEIGIDANWLEEVRQLVQLDAPLAAETLRQPVVDRERLTTALAETRQQLQSWPGDAGNVAVYLGKIDGLIEPLRYQVHLGDAWTDPAELQMIPLPVVELDLRVEPPAYARDSSNGPQPATRHVSVLEGSDIKLGLRVLNDKPLRNAWVRLATGGKSSRHDLAQHDRRGLDWRLDESGTPLAQVSGPVRFELQVTDKDGLHLVRPLRGVVRIRTDRPPNGSVDIVHRVVLPAAKPVIEYQVTDDYGIARVLLHTQVERQENAETSATDQDRPTERHSAELPIAGDLLLADQLPHNGQHEIDLPAFRVVKGDRLKFTLEVVDFRGQTRGQSYLSEPMLVEVSDEAGVLAAISAADEMSEQRLSEMIKQQLGIGETP